MNRAPGHHRAGGGLGGSQGTDLAVLRGEAAALLAAADVAGSVGADAGEGLAHAAAAAAGDAAGPGHAQGELLPRPGRGHATEDGQAETAEAAKQVKNSTASTRTVG